jgi:biotin carboxyl carrier protein
MKNTMRIGFVAFLLLVTSCAKKQDAEPSGGHKAESAARSAEHGELTVLKIDPSMLRDLHITTAKVEKRAGGDSATILGELRVNENAYAEVGAPIPSRIVRFEVATGGQVRAGEKLAILQSPEIGKAKAEMITAQSHVDLARQVLERKRRLGAERIVAQREIQEAESGLSSAEAELRSARRFAISGSGLNRCRHAGFSPVHAAVPPGRCGHRARGNAGTDGGAFAAAIPDWRPPGVMADGSRFRARRGAHPRWGQGQNRICSIARPDLYRKSRACRRTSRS